MTDCGHRLCELIGGMCSIATGRSRGCTPSMTSKTIAPDVFDEVRALVSTIMGSDPNSDSVLQNGSAFNETGVMGSDPNSDSVLHDETIRRAANRLAEIIRREARDDRNLVALARSDEPDLAPALEDLCMRRR
jgi:hypothetical protein